MSVSDPGSTNPRDSVPSTQARSGISEQRTPAVDTSSSPIRIVFFSSATGNTLRFVTKLGFPAERIPLTRTEKPLLVDYDFVLIIPTYGGGNHRGAVPKQVIQFLNVKENRDHCLGVISSGNTNFGTAYCLAGEIISHKLHVPNMYRFELLGTPQDVTIVQEGLEEFWQKISRTPE